MSNGTIEFEHAIGFNTIIDGLKVHRNGQNYIYSTGDNTSQPDNTLRNILIKNSSNFLKNINLENINLNNKQHLILRKILRYIKR